MRRSDLLEYNRINESIFDLIINRSLQYCAQNSSPNKRYRNYKTVQITQSRRVNMEFIRLQRFYSSTVPLANLLPLPPSKKKSLSANHYKPKLYPIGVFK